MSKKDKIVLFGTFDILHPGHIHYLLQGNKHGDIVHIGIVTESNELDKHPKSDLEDRKEMLNSLEQVDQVFELEKTLEGIVSQVRERDYNKILFGYDHDEYISAFEHLEADTLKSNKYKDYSTSGIND